MPPLSFLIVRNPYLDFQHLQFLVAALNQQSNSAFNTFWLDQTTDPEPLQDLLQTQAQFAYTIDHDPPQQVAGVPCWDLTGPFARFMLHPEIGEIFTYLHMECLPDVLFVESILTLWPALKQKYGHHFIAMLEQLRCQLEVGALYLEDGLFWQQLQLADLQTWVASATPYHLPQQGEFEWLLARQWYENAFLMPSELARETGLFSAPPTLYFQDVFDIFNYVQHRPYWQQIQWLKLPQSIIYHLNHPRAFEEYSEAFLKAVGNHPDLFEGLLIYDLDWEITYPTLQAEVLKRYPGLAEDLALDPQRSNAYLGLFYQIFRDGEKGTNHLWLQAIDRFHGYPKSELIERHAKRKRKLESFD